jgi:hypothetical protein
VHPDTHAAHDDPPLLIADYQGRPALTIRTDDWAPSCGRAPVANHTGTHRRDRPGVHDLRQVITEPGQSELPNCATKSFTFNKNCHDLRRGDDALRV